MKNLMEKLKNLDYKQAAVDHAEKAVLGMACLFVLICLAGTSWSRYEKEPGEFLRKVESETNSLAVSAWPQDKQTQYANAEKISLSLDQLKTRVDVTPFEYSTAFMTPLYPQHEKIKQPEIFAPEELIAKASEVILHFKGEQPESKNNFEVSKATKEDIERANDPNAPQRSATAPRGVKGPSATSPTNPTGGANVGGAGGADPSGAGGVGTAGGPPGGDTNAGMGANRKQEEVNAEGRRFVSVVGIVPLRKFTLSFAKALNIETPTAAAEFVQFHEFELERQLATSDADPWAGEWESVSREVAEDILTTIDDFDAEVVSSALTDSTFTMPLPKRMAGDWDFWATHPRLKILSKKQREEQLLVNEQALEAQKEKEASTQKATKKGGFAQFQHDVRGARRNVGVQGLQSMADQAMKQMNSDFGGAGVGGVGNVGGARGGRQAGGLHAIIAGQVLLFRYFDFNVEPGNAYRYRLRLVLRNPNWNQPIEELVDPAIARAEFLKTEWSQPTNPAVVQNHQQYFLTKVNRSGTRNSADINVLQWYQKAGTLIQAQLSKILPGQYIGAFKTQGRDNREEGGVETYVLRPANESLEKEIIELTTKDVLVDIEESDEIDPTEHEDLGLNFRKRGEAAQSDQALVVDQYGRLKLLDNFTGKAGTLNSTAKISAQNTPWASIVKKRQGPQQSGAGGSALDRLAGEAGQLMSPGAGGGPPGQGKGRSGRNRRNPTRKSPLRK